MRLPRFRFTVRRMMIAVAIVAGLIWAGLELLGRSERFLARSLEHVGDAAMEGTLVITEDGPAYVGMKSEKARWHEAMRRKYDYYGRRPWLPVPPDSPQPE
ncbi:MAG: hypothetical protein JWN86_4085 [Planctomycetota bacterium]|nr:hypothetical protein [Planctomycetota bacterium]